MLPVSSAHAKLPLLPNAFAAKAVRQWRVRPAMDD
jgi:hypothetical protein